MSDVRHQATWRLVADGRWEVGVQDEIPAHLPSHLRDRFENDRERGQTLRCAASEVPAIMAEIVTVAVWWERKKLTRFGLRAVRPYDAVFFRDTMESAGVEILSWFAIGTAEGDVRVEFYSDATFEMLRGAMNSTPGGDRMRETLVALDAQHEDEDDDLGPEAPAAEGEA